MWVFRYPLEEPCDGVIDVVGGRGCPPRRGWRRFRGIVPQEYVGCQKVREGWQGTCFEESPFNLGVMEAMW